MRWDKHTIVQAIFLSPIKYQQHKILKTSPNQGLLCFIIHFILVNEHGHETKPKFILCDCCNNLNILTVL